MIKSFACAETEDLFNRGRNKRYAALAKVACRKLDMLDAAAAINDLRSPPGNRLEALSGNLEGYHSVRINRQWRIVFRWENNNAEDVEIMDYH